MARYSAQRAHAHGAGRAGRPSPRGVDGGRAHAAAAADAEDRHADRLGIGGNVRELMSPVPIGDVDSIGVRRLALGYTITLEANSASGTKRFADAFDRTRGVRG
jgi:hypothetical protein